jgi:hypothetical protein
MPPGNDVGLGNPSEPFHLQRRRKDAAGSAHDAPGTGVSDRFRLSTNGDDHEKNRLYHRRRRHRPCRTTFGTALAGSASPNTAKRSLSSTQQGVQMAVPPAQLLKRLQGNGGASKKRECTWTNENIAECSEEIGDTIVFTCFDHNGNSIGC